MALDGPVQTSTLVRRALHDGAVTVRRHGRAKFLALAMLVMLLVATPGSADERTIEFSDPTGDAMSGPEFTGTGDLINLRVAFDDETGAYTATFTADPATPFSGTLRLDLYLTNLHLDNYHDLAEIDNSENPITLAAPTTSLVLSGIAPGLAQWQGGQVIRASIGTQASRIAGVDPYRWEIDSLELEAESIVMPAPPIPAPHLIRFEFSGELAACADYGGCAGTALEQLLGTEFSGVALIPYQGDDLVPDDEELGVYRFETDAYMSLETASPAFDLAGVRPVEVIVRNCIGSGCPYNADGVWLKVRHNGYDYYLGFSTPRPSFVTDAIPSVAALDTTYPSFEITTPDFSSGIRIDTDNNPATSPMSMSIAMIPLTSTPATTKIPAMPAAMMALLGLAFVLLGVRASRMYGMV